MFTNEFEFDASVTIVLDETGEYEDIELCIGDDYVALRQYDEDVPNIIILSPIQWDELLLALKLPEGAYHTRGDKR